MTINSVERKVRAGLPVARFLEAYLPLPVAHCKGVRSPIASMPGNFQLSVDMLVEECQALVQAGVGTVILFGIPEHKDELRAAE